MQIPATALLAVGVSAFSWLFTKLYAARRPVWRLQQAGLPMPEFGFLAGHLLTVKNNLELLPANAVVQYAFWQMSKRFPSGIFYVNLWPFSGTLLVIATPSGASQATALDLSVCPEVVGPIETITGGPSLLSMSIGPEWKRWRRAFSPGFSPGYMMGLAPAIVDEVAVFRKILLGRCSSVTSDIFQLEDLTLKMTFDIIASVTLDARLQYQTQDNPLARALRAQIEWTSFGTTLNPLKRYLAIRPLIQWINGRRINNYISMEIDKRFAERIEDQAQQSGLGRSKTVVALLMDELLQDVTDKDVSRVKETVKKTMTPQLRAFLFAGLETTSSTLLYCYYLLSANPEALARVLGEHDEVFGPDAAKAHDLIRQDPQCLNHLPYTTAVIKEVLRIFPPAAPMRRGRPGAEIIDDEGRRYPTEGCNVWTTTMAIHNDPQWWVDAEAFRPERWLVGPEDPLYPVKGAWLPFYWGPKSCIGQTLVMLELRIALVMTLREVKITPAYEEWDSLHPKPGTKAVDGNRGYQAQDGGGGSSPHPADSLPVKVTLREE
ncbi:AflN/verA/monooxygenase [Xylariales sp. AK1849]|nr:AflN/verA/monooxygenase [Xylariales sp. AK1849]